MGVTGCTSFNIWGKCALSKPHSPHRCMYCGGKHPGYQCESIHYKTANQWKLMVDKWNRGGYKNRQIYDKDKYKDKKEFKKN